MDIKFKTLASNTAIFALGSLGSKVIMFFFLPLYTNVLSTAEYGVSELVLTLSSLIVPFISFSMGDAVLRFSLAKKEPHSDIIKNAFSVIALGSIIFIISSPLLGLYPPIHDYVIYLVALSILTAIRTSCQLYTKGTNKNALFAIDSIINTFVLAISNIVFLLVLKMGIRGYLLADIFAVFISIVFLIFANHLPSIIMKTKINIELLKQMLRYSLPMILNSVSWWIIHSMDKIMLQRYLTSGDVGIYTVASKIPSLINTITYFFSQAWIISAITEYDNDRDKKFYAKSFKGFNFALCFIVSAVLLILKPFMSHYVGADFVSSWQYVPLLLIAAVFRNYSDFFGAFFSSAKKNINVMLTTVAGAVCNLVLNAVLIPLIGIQGAVIGTAASYIVIALYRMIGSRKIMAFHIDKPKTLLSILIVILQSVFVTLDYYPYYISLGALILVLIINFKIAKDFYSSILGFVKNKIHKERK